MTNFFDAAVLVKQKHPLSIKRIEMPSSLALGQVLVKIYYTGICGSQIGEINGVKGKDKFLPHMLGHEASGIVIDCGAGVKKVKIGDKVIIHWMKTEGIESDPPIHKCIDGSKINSGNATTFSKFAVISENRLSKVLHGISMIDACLFGCTIPTAFGMLNNEANLKIGEKVLIFGAGSIGLSSIFASNILGCGEVLTVDINQKKLLKAKKLGSTHILLYKNSKDFDGKLKKYNPDLIVDTTGLEKVITLSYNLINKGGRLLLVGVPDYRKKIKINTFPLHLDTKIFGTSGKSINSDKFFKNYQNYILKNKINLKKIFVEKIIKLKDLNLFIDKISKGKSVGKFIVNFN